MSDIDCICTDEPTCPHCGHAHQDAFEWGGGRSDDGTHHCAKCGVTFKWEREISVTYSTEPISSSTEGR